jgi:2-polyprenyl-3-methyl-5-hydroxy-6-metoxy-1,4-benzoquinol methylase
MMDGGEFKKSGETEENWLLKNKALRMDANNDMFDESRRSFHIERYQFARSFCAGKRVLDGACGTGYGSAILGQVAEQVEGVDLGLDAVEYARKNYAGSTVHFSKSLIELTPFEESSFDTVVSFETIEHTLSPRAAVREFVRLLKGDGVAVISIPNNWGYTEYHFFDFNLNMLSRLLSEYFGSIEFYYQNSGLRKKCQPSGIGPLDAIGEDRAECILVVCRAPKKGSDSKEEDRMTKVMDEIYESVFARHQEFRKLYKYRGGSFARLFRRVRGLK